LCTLKVRLSSALQFGYTSLIVASQNGFSAVVDRLVEARADVNATANVPFPPPPIHALIPRRVSGPIPCCINTARPALAQRALSLSAGDLANSRGTRYFKRCGMLEGRRSIKEGQKGEGRVGVQVWIEMLSFPHPCHTNLPPAPVSRPRSHIP
jgi:hypothetical protein